MDELTQTFELLSGEALLALVALGATLLHFLVEPIRWWFVLTRRQSVSFATTFQVFSTTALLSYTLPFKMGLPVRHMLLKRTLRQSHFLIGSALFLDAIFVYLTWALASAFVLLTLSAGRPDTVAFQAGGLIALTTAAVVVALGMYRFRRAHLVTRTREAVAQLRGLVNPRAFLLAFATVAADLLAQGVKHWAILKLLGFEIGVVDAIGIAIVSITVGLFSFMPLGLGAYDVVLIALVAAASAGGAPVWIVPIVSRSLSVLVAAVLGSLSAARLGIRLRDGSWHREVVPPGEGS